MKILWLSSGFLHPTTRGGQIRTLETLRRLRTRNEIDYLALHDGSREALERASEYCSRAWPIPFQLAPRDSIRFWMQTVAGLFSRLPVVAVRKQSKSARLAIAKLLEGERFDLVVCDFLTPCVNLASAQPFVLFEHNVETLIWRRYAERAADPIRRTFYSSQASRLLAFERAACRRAVQVIAVSEADAATLRDLCGAKQVTAIPTGVDASYFARPPGSGEAQNSALLFAGSMDWLPNIDGVLWFVEQVLPIIRRQLPSCHLTIAGRRPARAIRKLVADPRIRVTGTVGDIRPYLWESSVSIVPLRIGSGTRLKIYEAMAAEIPVVSTTIGAEGLEVSSPENIRIADSPESFAEQCLELLQSPGTRDRQAAEARRMVEERFSWEAVSDRFEEILLACLARR